MATCTIKILREVNNYTQEFVGEDILGISQNTYSRLEQNPNRITAEQAQKLSVLYQVPIAHLLSDEMPVLRFEKVSLTTTPDSHLSEDVQNIAPEVQLLREEIDYLRKQNSELLKMIGGKT